MTEGQEQYKLGEMKETAGGIDIDLTPFKGKTVKIAAVEVVPSKTKYGEDGKELPNKQTRPSLMLKVITEKVSEVKLNDGTMFELKGSELFGIKVETKDGKLVPTGWGPKTELAAFLKSLKISSIPELIGKEVVLRIRNDRYLGFYTQ